MRFKGCTRLEEDRLRKAQRSTTRFPVVGNSNICYRYLGVVPLNGFVSIRSFVHITPLRSLVVTSPSDGVVVQYYFTAGALASSPIVSNSDVPFCVRLSCACLQFVVVRVQTAPCFVLLYRLFQSYFHFPVPLRCVLSANRGKGLCVALV